jgi:oligopeptide/dipeptide ABC transporter ATP-binding protein
MEERLGVRRGGGNSKGEAMADSLALQVRDLRTLFFTKRGVGKAVDGISFDLKRGETLGLVGESGCGKSIACLSLMRLNPKPASRIVAGQVLLNGEDLLQKPEREMRKYRGRHIAIILQDPMTALNPVFTIGHQLYEPLRIHQQLRGFRLRQRAVELLKLLRIPAPEARLSSFPHQFSGGMRQRAVGAIALSCTPQVLIADEPTTSLDVTVQAAFLELLKEIQRQSNLAILFVTHDFGVVAQMCDRVAVMYAGKIVETAETQNLFDSPAHPYTEALLNSVPDVSVEVKRLYAIVGQPPSIYNLPAGCPFAPRCPHVQDRCWQEFPPERQLADGHTVSCWRYV